MKKTITLFVLKAIILLLFLLIYPSNYMSAEPVIFMLSAIVFWLFIGYALKKIIE